MEIFQKRLNKLLKENEITLQKLADKIGTTKVSISRYKNGHRIPDILTLYKISKYFNVSCDYLLGVIDIKKPSWYNKLPEKLQNFIDEQEIDYLSVAKEAKDKNIPPEDIKTLINTFQELKPILDKLKK